MCAPFRKRVKIIIANEAHVYGWTLGESEIAEMGHSYRVGNSSLEISDTEYHIMILCALYSIFFPKTTSNFFR
jgi:hypothetical protein